MIPEPFTVAERVWTQPAVAQRRGAQGRKGRRSLPQSFMAFDCETRTDETQRLTFGVWRLYVDPADGPPMRTCVEEGVFYADDLPATDPAEFAVVRAYAEAKPASVFPGRRPRLRLLSRSEFVEQVLFHHGVRRQATIVGFNVPFDLSRLAVAAGHARDRNFGGVSLQLWEHNGAENQFRPRITIKSIDSRRHLIAFTSTSDRTAAHANERGRFLDCRTLAFALSDQAGSLEACCQRFGVPFTKRDVTHGIVTPEYIDYCREDVDATARLCEALLTEHALHPVELEPAKAFSPASIGKAYLRALRIQPVLERQADFPAEILGHGMAAFYGGRAECRIRRTSVPVVYCDFKSMYPTVNALMGNWLLLTARRIDIDDNTRAVRRLVNRPDLADVFFDPASWRQLACLVQIRPDGDILPVRAAYDPATAGYGIGVNPLTSDQPAWYALADVIAATILGGRPPQVVRAIRLIPKHRQAGLRALKLRGLVDVDPKHDDFFATLIEQRTVTRNNQTLSDVDRDRTQRFLKVLANSTSYGVLAEFITSTTANPTTVTVVGGTGDIWDAETTSPETPGRYCFPPLAACITAAARLMLALLEHAVTSAGGAYAFCDTDSMAIVATPTGGPVTDGITALTWDQVAGIVARFEALNPYNRDLVPGSVLEIEAENYRPDGQQRMLWCWAISAKRYVLSTDDRAGEYQIVKASEHGLGHLLSPNDDASWADEAWRYLLAHDHPTGDPEPAWLDQPALSRITVSGSTILRWFDHHNAGRSYQSRVKPANFLVVAYPDRLTDPDTAPVAPFTHDATDWEQLAWFDRHTSQPIRITTAAPDGTHIPGVIRVQTYRDVLSAYLAHPEHKSLGPEGEPIGRNTRGLLRRRPVHAIWPPRHLGKEANRIEDQAKGLIDHPDQVLNDWTPDHADWTHLAVPVLQNMTRREVAQALGVSRRSVERWSAGTHTPLPDTRRAVIEHLVAHARTQISANRRSTTSDPRALLWALANQTGAQASIEKEGK